MIFLQNQQHKFQAIMVWRRHTKFQIGMAAAIPVIPLPAPLLRVSCFRVNSVRSCIRPLSVRLHVVRRPLTFSLFRETRPQAVSVLSGGI